MFNNFKEILNIFTLSSEHQQKFKEQVEEEVNEKWDFFILSFFAVILITLGLILNNFVIILGGLLLTPLVWLVLAISLSVIQSKFKNLVILILFLGKVSLLSIITSFIIGLFSYFLQVSYQALNILQPTIFEFIMAFVVGFMAAFIVSYPKLGSFISRMIMSAVMLLPLCLTGIALAYQFFNQAVSAFLLFLFNIIAVIIGAYLFFLLARFKSKIKITLKSNIKVGLLVLLIIIILIPLILAAKNKISQHRQFNLVKEVLVANLKETQLQDLDIEKKADKLFIAAAVRTGKSFSNREMNLLASKISQVLNQSVNLQITTMPTWQVENIIKPREKNNQSNKNQNNQQLEGVKDKIFPKTITK